MSVTHAARLLHESEVERRPVSGGTLQWLVDQRLGAVHIMSYRLVIDPGQVVSHAHDGAEESLYVVDGLGRITVAGSRHDVSRGHAVFVPEAAEHSYENTGQAPLTLVGAMAPPIDAGSIRPVMPSLDMTAALAGAGVSEAFVRPRLMDEQRVTPTLMGERSFRVLVNPEVGCRQMTQFTGIILTGRAPLHAHPHEEAVYILSLIHI